MSRTAPSTDPYEAPRLYDLLFGDHVEDVAFYRAIAAAAGGEVLELGAGTGRLTQAMAQAGARVRAVERSPAMLEVLRSRRLGPHVRAEQRDFRDLPEATHPLVILPFNAVHHCAGLEDLDRLVAGIARSLRPGGVLWMDGLLPDPALYERDPDKRYAFQRRDLDGVPLLCWETSRWSPPIHRVRYTMRWPDNRTRHLDLAFHMFGLDTLTAHLGAAGLVTEHLASDFHAAPVTPTSTRFVLQARRAR